MLHDYRSKDGTIITVKQSIKLKVKNFIVRDGIKYHRVFSPPFIIIGSNAPKTIGALADKNTQRMRESGQLKSTKKSMSQKQQSHARKLCSMTPLQKENYVLTGKMAQ